MQPEVITLEESVIVRPSDALSESGDEIVLAGDKTYQQLVNASFEADAVDFQTPPPGVGVPNPSEICLKSSRNANVRSRGTLMRPVRLFAGSSGVDLNTSMYFPDGGLASDVSNPTVSKMLGRKW